jgi:NAD(P)-dependent dehydrogenase (short-subunit alcohol dehydrogenase family)
VAARRVAWVTGAGRGIGRASAEALARQGCDVALTARSAEEVRSAAEACLALGARSLAAPCDVTDAARLDAAHRDVVRGLGAVDVLVNAAGMARSASFLKTSPELLEQHWRLNVVAPFHAMQLVLPGMAERGWGRVVNVASIAGKTGAPYISAYAASKHALLGVTRSAALEFAGKGITVNAVCPGYVDTRMTRDNAGVIAQVTGMGRDEALQRMAATSPQKRLIGADEVAAVVAHLAGDAARGINGQAITIDGGAVQW